MKRTDGHQVQGLIPQIAEFNPSYHSQVIDAAVDAYRIFAVNCDLFHLSIHLKKTESSL